LVAEALPAYVTFAFNREFNREREHL